jgi:predicted ArsR family transcriptional regulator
MGFSEAEIAKSLGIDKAAVHRHIEHIRQEGSWADKPAKQRFADLLQLVVDGTVQTIKESWVLFHAPGNAQNPIARLSALARVQSGIAILRDMIPGSENIMFEEDLNRMLKEQAEISATIQKDRDDRAIRDKIQQLQG